MNATRKAIADEVTRNWLADQVCTTVVGLIDRGELELGIWFLQDAVRAAPDIIKTAAYVTLAASLNYADVERYAVSRTPRSSYVEKT